MTPRLTHNRLVDVLEYDPQSGTFYWKKRTSNRIKVGNVAGRSHILGYRQIGIDGETFWEHRLAIFYVTGAWPKEDVDHINGNPRDNRFENLRCATHQQNIHNARGWSNATSKFKGVSRCSDGKRRKRWLAQIKHNGKWRYLGRYHTEEEAGRAYDAAATEVYGEFARKAVCQ